jgi:hypothetical protein
MADNVYKTQGRPRGYTLDRGGVPAEGGPFIGEIMNNIDSIRSGRLQVYIEAFGGGDKLNKSLWRTVKYLPPFYGVTQKPPGGVAGEGTWTGNPHSYGMWFTPPDIGVKVLCFFVEGDPSQGYYVGCVPEPGVNHMIPGVGSAPRGQYIPGNQTQDVYLADALAQPVTEINAKDNQIISDPKFFDTPKPVHATVAASMFQQGISNDIERGPITSSSQRETPSAVYGVSTPGRPVYQGGAAPNQIRRDLLEGKLTPLDVAVIARQGGHSLVMDDGDLENNSALVRIRTSKGHQITMSDDGNFFYVIHANGQTWIELGVEGTVDVFSTNSVNIRTNGDINLHADQDVNIFAGRNLLLKSKVNLGLESEKTVNVRSNGKMSLYSQSQIGVLADGSLALKSSNGSWDGSGALKFKAGRIDLNGGGAETVSQVKAMTKFVMDDTKFDASRGWQVEKNKLESIVTRAPSHEPWPYHNLGVPRDVNVTYGDGSAPPPAAVPVPQGFSIQKK